MRKRHGFLGKRCIFLPFYFSGDSSAMGMGITVGQSEVDHLHPDWIIFATSRCLSWNFVQTFVVPNNWILITLLITWLSLLWLKWWITNHIDWSLCGSQWQRARFPAVAMCRYAQATKMLCNKKREIEKDLHFYPVIGIFQWLLNKCNILKSHEIKEVKLHLTISFLIKSNFTSTLWTLQKLKMLFTAFRL